MSSRPQPPTRRQLATFIPDQQTLRSFEQLFEAVPGDILALESLVNTVFDAAQGAGDTAQAARAIATRAADELRDLMAAVMTARDYGAKISTLERRINDLECALLAQR